MSTTDTVTVGDRGRLVLPAPLRTSQRWEQGTLLHTIETEDGVILATRNQLRRLIAKQLRGESLVDELIRDRRAAAALDERE